MAMLYRVPLVVRRKAPYVQWANSFGDVMMDAATARQPSLYLVAVPEHEPTLEDVVSQYWEEIFEEELSQWMQLEQDWPPARGRAVFDAWFDVELGQMVTDLDPDEPLTESDLDAEDIHTALHTCAWCGTHLPDGEGRLSAFPIGDRERLAEREGRALTLLLPKQRIVMGVVTPAGSDAAAAGDDLVFRVCNRACDQPLRKYVPKALKDLLARQ
jgi:hypothetical protein